MCAGMARALRTRHLPRRRQNVGRQNVDDQGMGKPVFGHDPPFAIASAGGTGSSGRAIVGAGPVIATGLLANIDIKRAPAAG